MTRESRRSNWFMRGSLRKPAHSAEFRRPPETGKAGDAQEFVIDAMPEEVPPASVRLSTPTYEAQAAAELPELPPNESASQQPPSSFRQRLQVSKAQAGRQVRHQLGNGRRSAIVGAKSLAEKAEQGRQQTSAQIKARWREHRWGVLSGAILVVAGGTALSAVVWLSRVPPAPECQKINMLSSDSERLYCAQQSAASGKAEDLLAAIGLVKNWSKDHPMFPQAERALAQWSELLLLVARERLGQSDLDGAMKLAQQIPNTSPNFKQVQEEIGFWQVERNRGQQIFEKVQTALKKQLWEDASALLAKLTMVDDPLWRNRLTDIRSQLENEKKAGVYLKQSLVFVKENPVEKWGQAMTILLQIDRKTFVWQRADKEINQWRDRLFKLTAEHLFKQDVARASVLLKSVPEQVEMTDSQRDLLRLVRATEVDGENQEKSPLLNQLWGLMMATNSMQQVETNSPYHKNAQTLLPRLSDQIENAVQIEVARGLASFGQVGTMNLAIKQAEQIAAKQPRRLQAQTLLAEWRKSVQQLEDRPVIKQAQLLAKAGSLDQLRSAVDLIDRIPKGRLTFKQAQAEKGEWVAQIQTIEDKPILNEARSIAQSGQLGKAIRVASAIRPGRSLYWDAQNNIGGWASELRAIEDRAILARAADLAAQGSLSRAIDVASQVSGGPVASEAQQSIGQWSQEREQFRRNAAPAPVEAPAPNRSEPEPPPIVEAPPPAAYEPEPAPERLPEPVQPVAPPPNSVEVPTESDPAPPSAPVSP
jgi:hypothetical protein